MSFSSTTRRNDYIGNGTTAEYDYTFRIFAETDLRVTLQNPDTQEETTLVLSTDYTVAGVNEAGGGSITLVDANQAWLDSSGFLDDDWALTVRRVLPLTQETDVRNQGPYLPEAVEDQLDRAAMIALQQQDEIDRGLKLPETEDPDDFTLTIPTLADRAGKFLYFDDDGNPMAAAGTTEVAVSSFMEDVVAATTWYGAQNLLGFDGPQTIASAGTVDLGNATGNWITISHTSGTTAITSLGGAALPAGTLIETKISISAGTLTMTHHATNLVLLPGANMTLTTGDRILWRKKHDSNAEWEMVAFFRGSVLLPFLVDAKGDLLVGTAADNVARKAVGSNGKVLTADSAQSDGLAWNDPPSSFNYGFNDDKEVWGGGPSAVPTSWTTFGAGAAHAREGTIVKYGSYSEKITPGGGAAGGSYQDIDTFRGFGPAARWQGIQVTHKRWVYATAASQARIYIDDGVGTEYSDYHPGDSAWRLLSVTRTLDAAATRVRKGQEVAAGGSAAYFDHGGLFEGAPAMTVIPPSSWKGAFTTMLFDSGDTAVSAGFYYGNSNTQSTEGERLQRASFKAVARDLHVVLEADPGADDVNTLRVNGSSKSLAATVANGQTLGADTANEVEVAKGDRLTILCSRTGGTDRSHGATLSLEEIP